MSRVQILYLPSVEKPDGTVEPRFALVVDDCENSPEFALRWERFGEKIGAAGVLVTPQRVDFPDNPADGDNLLEFDTAVLGRSIADAMRFHLESPEASDALRGWYERRRAAEGAGTKVENHFHFQGSDLDRTRLEQVLDARDLRRRGDGGAGVRH